MTRLLSLLAGALLSATSLVAADRLFVEAESFRNHGGWSLDTQFIENMGSPYLLAHGLGTAVKDATTSATVTYTDDRIPGDVHLHFFGTSKLSFSTRKWKYQEGDIIQIQAPDFSAPLINTVHQLEGDSQQPTPVRPA